MSNYDPNNPYHNGAVMSPELERQHYEALDDHFNGDPDSNIPYWEIMAHCKRIPKDMVPRYLAAKKHEFIQDAAAWKVMRLRQRKLGKVPINNYNEFLIYSKQYYDILPYEN